MPEIIIAAPADFPRVRTFYHSIIDEMHSLPWFPCWEKGVYPSDESLRGYLDRGELRLMIIDNRIAAAAALGGSLDCSDDIHWPSGAKKGEYAAVNLVAVHPDFGRRGLAKQMVSHLMDLSRERGFHALRLNVVNVNDPAKRLYTSLGFQYVDCATTIFDDGSSLNFELYERIL